MLKFDSRLEKDFSLDYHLIKNTTRYIIWEHQINTIERRLRNTITYMPDFVIERGLDLYWVEVKGWHPNLNAYYLKRKLILHYCFKNNVHFIEINRNNNQWIFKYFTKKEDSIDKYFWKNH